MSTKSVLFKEKFIFRSFLFEFFSYSVVLFGVDRAVSDSFFPTTLGTCCIMHIEMKLGLVQKQKNGFRIGSKIGKDSLFEFVGVFHHFRDILLPFHYI